MNTPRLIKIVRCGDQYQLEISGSGFSPYRAAPPGSHLSKQAERDRMIHRGSGYVKPWGLAAARGK